ncbi:unnamed protein product [Adineta steineri]|uniref:cholesterol 7-desaturase n=1 Tax=Adineta steineri TaxID=433720 RepID=A0A819B7N7_9BILA|nr:unnamed protein product [Adineta steineri]CAF3547363.1 unnamed protein product [Adineta steineri]CAF3797357.1 unnamed protein product [Adineta steineri]
MITDYIRINTTTILCVIVPLIYIIYYRIFRYFIFDQRKKVTKGKTSRGKCPPFFPNGWYWIINSCDLKPGDVKPISYCGRNVVLFRGKNGNPYVLDAYCAHMGAHLGEGGKVRYNTCIECPFHGWTFDGETGNCILPSGENKINRVADKFEYHDIEKCTPKPDCSDKNNSYLQQIAEHKEVKIKKYTVREMNGSVFVWYHSDDKLRESPTYELFDLTNELKIYNMEGRGESINYVNCHVQEIPENGADFRHFDFLHQSVLDIIFPFIKFDWSMTSERASHPQLNEIMTHPNPEVNAYKMRLLKTFINDSNRDLVNVISLNSYIQFFGKHRLFVFNATGFQLGPSIVYLFLWSPYFQATFFQTVTPLEKFNQRIMHRIFSTKPLPYWLTALMLLGEVKQIFSDMNIWNNKIFGSQLNYNMKNDADKSLHAWRNWYAQFYEGCYEYENKTLLW